MTTINFDDLATGTVVNTQYSGVKFSSDPGYVVGATTLDDVENLSLPNALVVVNSSSGTIDPKQNLYVDFAQPVNDLSFFITGDNSFNVGKIDVYTTTGSPITLDLMADNVFSTTDPIDLSSFTNITRISVNNITDPEGIGFDDFQFNLAPVNLPPVPVYDVASTAKNSAVTISASTLLANDTDPNSNPLRITGVSNATNGTVVLNNNGTLNNSADDYIVFTPTTEFSRERDGHFSYTLSDGSLTNIGNVIVLVETGGRNNVLTGTPGNDRLTGGQGKEILDGLGGNDILTGGQGQELLRGGTGNDILTGGNGSDTFLFRPLDGPDIITDFKDGVDFIGLSGGLSFGALSFSGSNIIVTASNEILATLTGINTTTLTAADFLGEGQYRY